jgi:transcriptional regulator with XRE-family HTH domain
MQPIFYKKQPKDGRAQLVEIIKWRCKGGKNVNNHFSENLKKIRKEHNLSQEQLADELGVSRQAISKWESAVAYPEMDKIIALCDKFDLNIDDLLHKDIGEVKGEEESNKKINNFMNDFLKFFSDTVDLFSKMDFKSKVKCLFEQFIIILFLFFLSLIVSHILNSFFSSLFGFIPGNGFNFITTIMRSVVNVALFVAAVTIIAHIFKTRYLSYYNQVKKDYNEKNKDVIKAGEANEICFKTEENSIVIRDPKHSEYGFINGLFKIIVGVFKFFLLCYSLHFAFMLVGLFVALIMSFMLYKTGLFFVGLILSILSSAVIIIIIMLLVLNFVFNRKNNKKVMIWGFLLSLVMFGVGCGLTVTGALQFDVTEDKGTLLETKTVEYDMKDNVVLYPNTHYDIEFIESDNDNIKVEYSMIKYCNLEERINDKEGYTISGWTRCEEPMKLIRDYIKVVNEKKVILIESDYHYIKVYSKKANLEKIEKNRESYFEEERKRNEKLEQDRLDELNEELNRLEENNN